MQKKAVEEHELEPPQQQQQQQQPRQQKGEKGAASKQGASSQERVHVQTAHSIEPPRPPSAARVARRALHGRIPMPPCPAGVHGVRAVEWGEGAASSKQWRRSRCTRANMWWGDGQREGVG